MSSYLHILETQILSVSDAVSDLLGLGVVEIMGSQLTDMVSHHWWLKFLFFQKDPPRVIQILCHMVIKNCDPSSFILIPKPSNPLSGAPLWPPCDQKLWPMLYHRCTLATTACSENFSNLAKIIARLSCAPGIILALCHCRSPNQKKSFVCRVCFAKLTETLFVKRCAARGKARPAGYMVSFSCFVFNVAFCINFLHNVHNL